MKTILCYSIPRWKSFSAGDRSKIHHTDLIHSSSSQTTCLFSTCCELSVDDVILFYLPTLLEHLACFQKPQRQSLRNKNVKHQMLIRKQQLSSVFSVKLKAPVLVPTAFHNKTLTATQQHRIKKCKVQSANPFCWHKNYETNKCIHDFVHFVVGIQTASLKIWIRENPKSSPSLR